MLFLKGYIDCKVHESNKSNVKGNEFWFSGFGLNIIGNPNGGTTPFGFPATFQWNIQV